jgi:site-specific recombinase XerD
MQRTPAIQVKAIVLTPPMAATMQNVSGQLAPSSRKTYTIDAKHFAQWLASQALSLTSLDRDDLVAYRAHLAETYAQSTAARMWAVVRRLLDEAVQRGLLLKNPAEGIRGFKAGDDESPHRALKREEAQALLGAIDRRTALGKRDYALLMLLLRTGIRRAEVVALTISDLVMEQGYHVAIIRHGKGNKRGLAKLPVEVRQALMIIWRQLAGRVLHQKHHSLSVSAKGIILKKGHCIPTRWSALSSNARKPSGSRCLRMECGPASLLWHLRAAQISHWSRTEQDIKIQGRHGGIKKEGTTFTGMPSISFG